MIDPYSLHRFVDAQAPVFARVVDELKAAKKRSHWMWFVFPQLAGLGISETARHYAIRSLDEARAYLRHPVLGPRLLGCTQLLLAARKANPRLSAGDILGVTDEVKLHSCMTLFAQADPAQAEFAAAITLFFGNLPDVPTLRLLGLAS